MRATTGLLLAAGANINELNAVRKHLETLKGGGLAAAAAPARVVALAVSDVLGDPLDVIASGPTVGDTSTYAEAWEVIARRGLASRVPAPGRHAPARRACAATSPRPRAPTIRSSRASDGRDRQPAARRRRGRRAAPANSAGSRPSATSTMQGEAREAAHALIGLGRWRSAPAATA